MLRVKKHACSFPVTVLHFHGDGMCDLIAGRFRNGEMLINLANYLGPVILAAAFPYPHTPGPQKTKL